MNVRVYSSLAAHDRDDARFWAAVPVEERVRQVWALSEAQWRLRGEFPDASGLCRSVAAFVDRDVRFLIVGAYALGVHGRPRATGDLDVWVDATPDNAERVIAALRQFGAPTDQVTAADFSRPGIVFQMGLSPVRIDVLTELSGVTFAEAWPGRTHARLADVEVDVIGRDMFIRNKRATGRARDLGDIEALGE
jgi:hypothetical protein